MKYIPLMFTVLLLISCKTNNDKKEETNNTQMAQEIEMKNSAESEALDNFKVTPISHATMILDWDGTIIYVDPVGGSGAFQDQPNPDIILITDIHGDHLDVETVAAVYQQKTQIIAPKAVQDKMPQKWKDKIAVLGNGEEANLDSFNIRGIAMYNLRDEAKKFHSKGRGNGYVITHNDARIYISGDTEDIPEMRNLNNIDAAFVCMNLPYTMPVEAAADAVLEFKPNKVYPYHYRGTNGLSDVGYFKSIVNDANEKIEVVQLDWYPNL